jgi:FkbM family methyltransferase
MFRHSSFVNTPYGFKLSGNDNMVATGFEQDEIDLVLTRLKDCDIFVDIGANIGLYTCLALSCGRHVIAIEPLRDNLDYLFKNIRENGFQDVEVFPVGLGSRPGLVDLYGGATGASLVKGWANSSPAYRTTVPLTTMDGLLAERFRNAKIFIKMDVEGAEEQVLEGATRTLSRVPAPTWMVEICLTEHHPRGMNPNFSAIFDKFWRTGYEAFTVGGGRRSITEGDVERWVSTHKDEGHNYEFAVP